jgi:hypothetical protein
VDIPEVSAGDLLQFNGSEWVNIAQVPGENIELKDGGAIVHGSGLMVNLSPDGTLVVADNALQVGVVGAGNIGPDAVALGGKTSGDYVASLTAGAGLSGDGSGEGSTPTLSVNVDGTTLVIVGDTLRVGTIDGSQLQDGSVTNAKLAEDSLTVTAGTGLAGGGPVALGGTVTVGVADSGIGAAQLADGAVDTDAIQDGSVTNAKLAENSLTVAAGTGLAGGGTVALGGSVALAVADNGIGLAQLAPDTDASGKGFRAASAASADWSADADAVDGAGLDDGAAAANDVLWSSLRVKEYVDGLVLGLDWQDSVVAFVAAVPAAPVAGLRVIASGVAGWQDGSIYEYDGAAWVETAPNEGFALWVEDEDRNYVHNGTAWVPLSSTQDHESLSGLLGGDEGGHYHLGGALYGALTDLGAERLLAADEGGLPQATALTDWLAGTAAQVSVAPDGEGGAVLSLPQDIAPASSPAFAGLALAGYLVTAVSNDPTLAGDRSTAVVTEHAAKGYVDAVAAGQDSLAELADVDIPEVSAGDLLQFDGTAWINVAIVPGQNIELAADGGITHGSGLRIDLDPSDLSLLIDGNWLKVGEIGAEHVRDGSLTTGDVRDWSLTGDDLALDTIPIDRLLGISGDGRPGQTVLASGDGGFMLGSELPMYLSRGTPGWAAVRLVDTGPGSEPWGMAQAPNGYLYVADSANHCILLFSHGGEYLGWYGAGYDAESEAPSVGFHYPEDPEVPIASAEVGGFDTPLAVAVMEDRSGYGGKDATAYGPDILLWVADSGNDRVQVLFLGMDKGYSVYAEAYGGEQIDLVGLSYPSGIAVDGDILYIADTGNYRVVEAGYCFYTYNLYTHGWYGAADTTGAGGYYPPVVASEDPPPAYPVARSGDLGFFSPQHIAVAYDAILGTSVLAVADIGHRRVMLIDVWATAMLGWIGADSDGGRGWHDPGAGATPVPASEDGAFQAPLGVALGGFGLAVSDAASDDLQFYSPSNVVKAYRFDFAGRFGGSGVGPGEFEAPAGLAPDADGGLWVCDSGNSRLQKLAPPHPDNYSVVPPRSGNVIIGGDTPFESAALQITSGDGGVLLPRYDLEDLWAGAIPNPVEGLLVYSYGSPSRVYKSSADAGFYFWNGGDWQLLGRPPVNYYGGLTYNSAGELETKLAYNGGLGIDSYGQIEVRLATRGGLFYDNTYPGGLAVDWSAMPAKASASGVTEVSDAAALGAALVAARGATADAPAVIHLAPGVFSGPLALNSHVDIVGSGIGKTIIRVAGGAAVTARNVANAGLRDLTIEVTGVGGSSDVVGLQFEGADSTGAVRVTEVEVRVAGATGGRAVGIRVGDGAGTADGLRLDRVCVTVAAEAGGGAAGIEVKGTAAVADCELRVSNAAGEALGLLIDPRGTEGMVMQQVRVRVSSARGGGAACRVAGAGAVLLKGCILELEGTSTCGVLDVMGAGQGRGVRARLDQTLLRFASGGSARVPKMRVGDQARVDAFSTQFLGAGEGAVVRGSGQLAAYYCLIEGRSSSGASASYSFCTAVNPKTGEGEPMARADARRP